MRKFFTTKVLCFLGALGLHIGVAGFLMVTFDAPVSMPQPQVIHVSVVMPSDIDARTSPESLRQKTKLFEEKSEVKREKQEPVKQMPPQVLTTGLQHEDATEQVAAVTKPMPAGYLKNPPPVYPETARLRGQQGTVFLDVHVKADGKAKKVAISKSSGYHLLDKAALDTVRRWKFVPARKGNDFIEASVIVPVEFQIR